MSGQLTSSYRLDTAGGDRRRSHEPADPHNEQHAPSEPARAQDGPMTRLRLVMPPIAVLTVTAAILIRALA
ncbi:hypothetical protein [Streptomyces sp. NPDC059861]|uniref:hypothetical protein n=1 Tax=Streptomyces sp. NPDC059861 TaxID=3346974 RepID=UPI00364EC462